jgi:dephospho-CoA kinase
MAQNLTIDQVPYSQVVALTGGIGTGKSSASRFFEEKGAVTVSADELAHEVTLPGSPGLQTVVNRFGPGVLTAAGELNRPALAAIVFADPVARRDLEAITHPLIRQAALARFSAAAHTPMIVYDVPLLFEAGLDGLGFKAIVVVSAPAAIVEERLKLRGLSAEQISKRMAAQMPLAEKIKRADFVIDNSGTREELKAKSFEVFDQISIQGRGSACKGTPS